MLTLLKEDGMESTLQQMHRPCLGKTQNLEGTSRACGGSADTWVEFQNMRLLKPRASIPGQVRGTSYNF